MFFKKNKADSVDAEESKKEEVELPDDVMERYAKSRYHDKEELRDYLTNEDIYLLFCEKKDWLPSDSNIDKFSRALNKLNDIFLYSNIIFPSNFYFNIPSWEGRIFLECIFYCFIEIRSKNESKYDSINFHSCKFYSIFEVSGFHRLLLRSCIFQCKKKLFHEIKNVSSLELTGVNGGKFTLLCSEVKISESIIEEIAFGDRLHFGKKIDLKRVIIDKSSVNKFEIKEKERVVFFNFISSSIKEAIFTDVVFENIEFSDTDIGNISNIYINENIKINHSRIHNLHIVGRDEKVIVNISNTKIKEYSNIEARAVIYYSEFDNGLKINLNTSDPDSDLSLRGNHIRSLDISECRINGKITLWYNTIKEKLSLYRSRARQLEIENTTVSGKCDLRYLDIDRLCILKSCRFSDLLDLRFSYIAYLAFHGSNLRKLNMDCLFYKDIKVFDTKGLDTEGVQQELTDDNFVTKESCRLFQQLPNVTTVTTESDEES